MQQPQQYQQQQYAPQYVQQQQPAAEAAPAGSSTQQYGVNPAVYDPRVSVGSLAQTSHFDFTLYPLGSEKYDVHNAPNMTT